VDELHCQYARTSATYQAQITGVSNESRSPSARAQVFVNASTSDVVATTSVEALAMVRLLLASASSSRTVCMLSTALPFAVYHNLRSFQLVGVGA
jgi:hypothetical protein